MSYSVESSPSCLTALNGSNNKPTKNTARRDHEQPQPLHCSVSITNIWRWFNRCNAIRSDANDAEEESIAISTNFYITSLACNFTNGLPTASSAGRFYLYLKFLFFCLFQWIFLFVGFPTLVWLYLFVWFNDIEHGNCICTFCIGCHFLRLLGLHP